MVITQSGRSKYIMAESDSLQDPYMSLLDLKTSSHINLYNNSITGMS